MFFSGAYCPRYAIPEWYGNVLSKWCNFSGMKKLCWPCTASRENWSKCYNTKPSLKRSSWRSCWSEHAMYTSSFMSSITAVIFSIITALVMFMAVCCSPRPPLIVLLLCPHRPHPAHVVIMAGPFKLAVFFYLVSIHTTIV